MIVEVIYRLKQSAGRLKAQLQVLAIAYKDKRTPLLAKIIVGVTVAYMLSPIDLIPDFIPVLGILDDLIMVPLLIKFSLKMIPEAVMQDAKQLAENHPERLKKNNLLFAVLIIIIWLLLVFAAYKVIIRYPG